MNRNIFVKLALTTTMAAMPFFAGGSLGAKAKGEGDANTAKMAKKVHGWALKAEKDLGKGQVASAEQLAEMAVAADLTNADYRSLLARIYMAQGRFVAAERTLMDVIELGQVDARTVVGVAIMRIAQGKTESAISLIEANQSIVPASDYGLALALAGKTTQAVDVLTDAIRSDNATARTRQNLALAYALDGRWREARIMAVQDMPETQVNERITEWAQYARPGAYQMRVAGLLRVTPVADDPGQPVQLALSTAKSNIQMADAGAVQNGAVPVVEQSVAVAEVAPIVETAQQVDQISEPAAIAMGPQIRYVSIPVGIPPEFERAVASKNVYAPRKIAKSSKTAPLIAAPSGPTKTAVAAKAAAKTPVKLALAETATPQKSGGSHLVQLGAYTTAEGAKAAWQKLQAKHSALGGYHSASQSVVVNGKKFVRLAAIGLNSKASADSLCSKLKAGGGDCIVRNVGGTNDQPVKLASAKPRLNGTLKPRSVAIASR